MADEDEIVNYSSIVVVGSIYRFVLNYITKF